MRQAKDLKYGKDRNLKTNPYLRLAKTARRVSRRRFRAGWFWTSKKKDKKWGRASKRSLKNFAQQDLKEELYQYYDSYHWWEDSEFGERVDKFLTEIYNEPQQARRRVGIKLELSSLYGK